MLLEKWSWAVAVGFVTEPVFENRVNNASFLGRAVCGVGCGLGWYWLVSAFGPARVPI